MPPPRTSCNLIKKCYIRDILYHYKNSKYIAFTLAEVLITLGIIGVVAALTMPALIANHEKKVTVTGLKKVYSELSNMIKLSENENGEMATWDFPKSEGNSEEAIEFLNKYYAPYTNAAKVYSGSDMRRLGYSFQNMSKTHTFRNATGMVLSDGTVITIHPNTNNSFIWLFADINGFKKPNRIGRDVFVFDIYKWYDNKYRLKLWGEMYNKDYLSKDPQIPEEEYESNSGYYECNKNNKHGHYSGFYCGAVIQKDGWEIKDDYPW